MSIAIYLVLTLNIVTAVSIVVMLGMNTRMRLFPKTHKFGLWAGAAGLAFYAVSNIQFLGANGAAAGIFGWSFSDVALFLTSLGYWTILITMFIIYSKKIRRVYAAKEKGN